jgi:hypothetical protein
VVHFAVQVWVHLAPELGEPVRTTLSYAVQVLHAAIVLAWVHAAWTGIPAQDRGSMTPRRAALTLLVPLYNLYWAFSVTVAFCDSLDLALAERSTERRAPRHFGIVGCVVWYADMLIRLVVNFATPNTFTARWGVPLQAARWLSPSMVATSVVQFLWVAYMVQCNGALDELTIAPRRA